MAVLPSSQVGAAVARRVGETPVLDLHTHLFPPSHAGYCRSGLHELLTYHYLVAELLVTTGFDPATFAALSVRERARMIWEELFVRRTPLSEACRGVVTCLSAVGAAPRPESFALLEQRCASVPDDRIFGLAGVSRVVMTNNPFDPAEWALFRHADWNRERYLAALRLDALLAEPERTLRDAAGFLDAAVTDSGARYLALSLDDAGLADLLDRPLLDRVVLPLARRHRLPLALMIGVRRQLNPAFGDAGDALGGEGLAALERLLVRAPDCRVLVTALGQGMQHRLAIIGRKFPNLCLFGFWWFMNQPSLIAPTLEMRLDLLGTHHVPQHSDARITDQLIYKWRHFRQVLAGVLEARYLRLIEAGWPVDEAMIARDVRALLHDNAARMLGVS